MGINAMSKFHFWSTVGTTIWFSALAAYLTTFTAGSLLFEAAAYMSGRSMDIGRGLMAFFVSPEGIARTKLYEEALIIAIILTTFVVGGMVGNKLLGSIGFGKTILIVGSLIGTACIMVLVGFPAGEPDTWSFERAAWALILPFAMGIQNAITTLTSVGRTTHVTGTLTDLGIAIGNREHRKAIFFFSMWAGFAVGSGIAFVTFLHIPSTFIRLLILAIAFGISGSFYAHPAVVRRLSPVISMTGGH